MRTIPEDKFEEALFGNHWESTGSKIMNFEEYAAKPVLVAAGIAVPKSQLATTLYEAGLAAGDIGPCVVKAQVPMGKRGKAGVFSWPPQPRKRAPTLGTFSVWKLRHAVEKVLIEAQCNIVREFYAAILNDPETKGPVVIVLHGRRHGYRGDRR